MSCELRRPYLRVTGGGAPSCGGSQDWFAEKSLSQCGCGVVACTDTLLYLTGREELTREEYLDYAHCVAQGLALIPGRGVDGVRLAMRLNKLLRREGLPLRASWAFSGARFWTRLEEQLSRDVPVILAAGPNLPLFWKKDALTLFARAADGGYRRDARVTSHFLTATGLDETWVRVSSWGRELYIARAELDRYRGAHGTWFTNMVYIRQK